MLAKEKTMHLSPHMDKLINLVKYKFPANAVSSNNHSMLELVLQQTRLHFVLTNNLTKISLNLQTAVQPG